MKSCSLHYALPLTKPLISNIRTCGFDYAEIRDVGRAARPGLTCVNVQDLYAPDAGRQKYIHSIDDSFTGDSGFPFPRAPHKYSCATCPMANRRQDRERDSGFGGEVPPRERIDQPEDIEEVVEDQEEDQAQAQDDDHVDQINPNINPAELVADEPEQLVLVQLPVQVPLVFQGGSPPGSPPRGNTPPPPPAPVAAPDPAMAHAAAGSQMALIPTYDGEPGSDVDLWMATLIRMSISFAWIPVGNLNDAQDAHLASVAKNKLVGKAAFWLDTERRGGTETVIWSDIQAALGPPVIPFQQGLKAQLLAIFKVDVSQLEATEAVMDLVMKSSETINQFYTRVKWSMEVKNHTVTLVDKALAPYIAERDRDLFTFFLAGLPAKYRDYAMTGDAPPTEPDVLRRRCAQLEAMQTRTKRINALATNAAGLSPDSPAPEPPETEIEKLTKEIAAMKSEMKCFNCLEKGHFSSACTKPKVTPKSSDRGGKGKRGNYRGRYRGRGNGGYRGNGNGGGGQGRGGWVPNYGQTRGGYNPWHQGGRGGGGGYAPRGGGGAFAVEHEHPGYGPSYGYSGPGATGYSFEEEFRGHHNQGN